MPKRPRDPAQDLRRKVARKDELIAKWTAEAERCDKSDPAGWVTRKYCLGLARDAREKRDQLQAELGRLSG